MQQRSLITGGSSGIGLAFAKALAARGDALVLCARDANRLQMVASDLKAQFGVDVETVPADLATDAGQDSVASRLGQSAEPVDLLINNAGFGMKGGFLQSDFGAHQQMLRVNVEAVVRLTHAALGAMTARGSGAVLNVGSMAPVFPWVRPAATYASTKAFVNTFTEALAPTLAGTGIRISVVMPGYVRTEFHQRAGIAMEKTPGVLWIDVDEVVRQALEGLAVGRVTTVPGTQYKVAAALARVAPRRLTQRVVAAVNKKTS